MDVRTQKEKVLTKIRHAIVSKNKVPFPEVDPGKAVFTDADEEEIVQFAENFVESGGQFVYCDTIAEAIENVKMLVEDKKITDLTCFDPKLQKLLEKAEVSFVADSEKLIDAKSTFTACEYLIARFGSIMVSSDSGSGRRANVYPETHLVLATVDQLVTDIKDALNAMKSKGDRLPSQIAVITGPSRTADIEKTLVKPAHGPKYLFLFLCGEDKLS